jgi:hypothetical protein
MALPSKPWQDSRFAPSAWFSAPDPYERFSFERQATWNDSPLDGLCTVFHRLGGGAVGNFVQVPSEELRIEAGFGETYREYKRRVPRWVGKIRN